MARYEVQSPLDRATVLACAERFFGKRGLGLRMTEDTATALTWRGGGGTVSVGVTSRGSGCTVEVATTEWDAQARRFLLEVRGSAWQRLRSALRR